MENERNYFIEDAKTGRVIFTGTEKECDEWYESHKSEFEDRVLIFRKGK